MGENMFKAYVIPFQFVESVKTALGKEIATGCFGADMQIELVNDGPVTIWIDSKNRE